MFQFTGFPSIRYGLAYGYVQSLYVGFPIQISPDHRLFAAPRSFSQLITSFVASYSQGIHHSPLFTSFIFFSLDIAIKCDSSVMLLLLL